MFTYFRILTILITFVCAALSEELSPAQLRIAATTKLIQVSPQSSQAYNDLAVAYCRRARETGDTSYFKLAEEALVQSTHVSPGDYEADKIRVSVLAGQHDFAAALKLAKGLNQRVPDDVAVWGLLVDANLALGNYTDADKAAQWMLDLRPGNLAGYIQASRVREAFGDAEGAIQLRDEALRRTPQNEVEEKAWLLTGLGSLYEAAGDRKAAEEALGQALKIYPDYHLTLAALAMLRTAEARYADAVALRERRYRLVQSTSALYDLAKSQERSGRLQESRISFKEFEKKATAEMMSLGNSNVELVFYYLDEAKVPAKALALAEREVAVRHDLRTLDAYSWALYKCGKYSEARAQADKVANIDKRDPMFLGHARLIRIAAKKP